MLFVQGCHCKFFTNSIPTWHDGVLKPSQFRFECATWTMSNSRDAINSPVGNPSKGNVQILRTFHIIPVYLDHTNTFHAITKLFSTCRMHTNMICCQNTGLFREPCRPSRIWRHMNRSILEGALLRYIKFLNSSIVIFNTRIIGLSKLLFTIFVWLNSRDCLPGCLLKWYGRNENCSILLILVKKSYFSKILGYLSFSIL